METLKTFALASLIISGTILPVYPQSVWTKTSSANDFRGATWAGSQWVAVASNNEIYTSPNGMTWTNRYNAGSNELESVVWNGNLIVTSGDPHALTSPDGVNWTVQTASLGYGTSITWTGSQFVDVGNEVLTSPDAINWTAQKFISNAPLNSVVWTGTQLVAVGNYGSILTSPDGVNWTIQNSGTTDSLNAVAWSGSLLAATTVKGNGHIILTSPDGITWTKRDSIGAEGYSGITWTGSQFVSVDESGNILTSPDGISWAALQTSTGARYVTWGDSLLVAVGQSGIWISQQTPSAIVPKSQQSGLSLKIFGSQLAATLPNYMIGQNKTVEIFTMSGSELFESNYGKNNSEIDISLNYFPKGYYVLKVKSINFSAIKQFEVQ